MAKLPYFLLYIKTATAAAKEADVCPEGKEKSVGLDINSSIPSFKSKGRTRATKGLRVRLQITRFMINARQTVKPIFRVFGMIERIIPTHIQNQPALPKKVIPFMIPSIKGWLRFSLIKSRITNSKFILAYKLCKNQTIRVNIEPQYSSSRQSATTFPPSTSLVYFPTTTSFLPRLKCS